MRLRTQDSQTRQWLREMNCRLEFVTLAQVGYLGPTNILCDENWYNPTIYISRVVMGLNSNTSDDGAGIDKVITQLFNL